MRPALRLAAGLIPALALGACQRTESARPADCAQVADTLTSFELGNYATPEQRAPVVAKHKTACESTRVTADEASCLFKAKDTWAARGCLPRMFPAGSGTAVATGSGAAKPANAANATGCATIAARMREAVMAQVGSQGSAAAAQMDKLTPVLETACNEDGWPKPVVQCAVDAKPGDMAAFQACTNQLPQDLQVKLSQRFTAVLQQEAPPAPPPGK